MWKFYNGVGAIMSVYNPRALASQYSSAEIILKGGTDSIIAGWTVNPQKYRDTKTRFFAYAAAGDMHCFNSECGFVQVRTDLPLDFVLKPVSKRRGKIYVNKFFIYRDPTRGVWWLQVGMKMPPITLGFWPQHIFKGLQEPATYAACGGEVSTPASLPPPEMGTGYMPQLGVDDASFCREFVVVDDKSTIVTADNTEAYANNDAYVVFDQYHRPSHYVLFGGPTPGSQDK
ncbi:protein neprosin-like [Silene latifolia]|uniref:protein neprosin-like n=1 Tax=Silene latifolia TaxID=37657 RepID=UPI003D776B5D